MATLCEKVHKIVIMGFDPSERIARIYEDMKRVYDVSLMDVIRNIRTFFWNFQFDDAN